MYCTPICTVLYSNISDAFLLHGSELHLYNKINIENVDINTRTVAIFRAQPTCVAQKSCGSCVALRENSTFNCMWCRASEHCSDGSDRLRQVWDDHSCHLENTTTCDNNHMEWRHSTDSLPSTGVAAAVSSTSTVVSAVVSSLLVIVLLVLLAAFLFLYGKYNENTVIGRQVKVLVSSYDQFGSPKGTSMELGKKEQQAKALSKPVSEFVNPMVNNNNVITAEM